MSICYRTEGTTVQMCGDSNVAEKWINGYYALGEKYKNKIGGIQKKLHFWWMKKVAFPSPRLVILQSIFS